MEFNKICYLGNHLSHNCGTICIHGRYITKNMDKEKILIHLINIFNQSLVISKEYYKSNKFVVEVYLEGLTFNNIDSQFLKELTTLFQSIYPDKLGKCIIFNPPIIFRTVWDVVKRIIDNETKEKIEICKEKHQTENTIGIKEDNQSI